MNRANRALEKILSQSEDAVDPKEATLATSLPLHPEHLADLQHSGLTEETIRALEIHSARPHDIPKLVGWDPPKVKSVLVFPYPNEDGFCRVKVFPPYIDKDGRTVKYLQPHGSGVRLYIHPDAEKVLGDPSRPLGYSEGEKKAAKACQEGVSCIGLGGLWNWVADGKPAEGLDKIAHADREETIYPDSDVWSRPDLQRAVYAFAKELESRGAKVSIAVILLGPNCEKWGLDDLLVRKGPEALTKLNHVSLKHKTFSKADQWWKEWVKRKSADSPQAAQVPSMTSVEREEALALLQDSQFLSRFLDTIGRMGCVGEEENKIALYLTFTSRKLDEPINNVVKAESAAGKNFLVGSVARFIPPEDVKSISSATPKAFHYLPEDLSHKVVIIAEQHGAEDADYSIRTLQSEGRITILVPEKDTSGRIVTTDRTVAGPVSFIETTTRAHLHAENETRTFDLYLDESEAQTSAIFEAQNSRYLGQSNTDVEESLKIWRNAQRLLERLPVIIPYVEAIDFPLRPLRVRRDRPRFLAMIEACTLLHQLQRERQEMGGKTYLVANLDDYTIARELVNRMLGPALKGATPKCEELVDQVSGFGELDFTRAEAEKKMGWDRKTVMKYLKEAVGLGCLDEQTEGRGKAVKYRFVKRVSQIGCALPTAEELREGLSKLSKPGGMPIGQVNS